MANGLFAQLGATFDPEAEVRRQRQEGVQRALSLVGGQFSNPGVQGAANIGALIGAGMGGVPGLTEQQKQAELIKKETQDAYSKWEQDNPDASEYDKAVAFNRSFATSAFRNGRGDVAAPLLQQIDQERRAREQQDKNLQLLGLNIDRSTYELDRLRNPFKRDTLQTIYKFGERDPMKGVTAYIDPEGNAILGDGSVIPMGEYTMDRPLDPNRGGGSGGAGRTLPNKSEQEKYRQQANALFSRGEVLTEMRNVLDEMYRVAGGPTALDVSGKVVSTTDRWISAMNNVWGVVAGQTMFEDPETGRKYELSSEGGRARYARDIRDDLIAAMSTDPSLRERIRNNAALADRYASLAIGLTYAQARANDPSGRLSENDFKAAALQTAQDIARPDAIRMIVMGAYERAVNELNFALNNFSPEIRNQIVPARQWATITDQFYRNVDHWNRPWTGTPAATSTKAPPASIARPNTAPTESDEAFLNRILGE